MPKSGKQLRGRQDWDAQSDENSDDFGVVTTLRRAAGSTLWAVRNHCRRQNYPSSGLQVTRGLDSDGRSESHLIRNQPRLLRLDRAELSDLVSNPAAVSQRIERFRIRLGQRRLLYKFVAPVILIRYSVNWVVTS